MVIGIKTKASSRSNGDGAFFCWLKYIRENRRKEFLKGNNAAICISGKCLSELSSSIEGRTIENYFIEQRIENAKELLTYGEMTLSQIVLELEYSSTAHLSAQFKKITGHTPSTFKQLGAEKRKALDQV
ncbi:MAG: AraC family transcriptional regulator [Chitinophagaceae bacterium]